MPFERDTCGACAEAAEAVSHAFTGGCKGCCARAVARSPQAFKARSTGDKYEPSYRALLEQFGITHNDVLAAYKADQLGKEPA